MRKPTSSPRYDELQFDHLIPLAFGGATTEQNLQILCPATDAKAPPSSDPICMLIVATPVRR